MTFLDENGGTVPVGTQNMYRALNANCALLIYVTFMASVVWIAQRQ